MAVSFLRWLSSLPMPTCGADGADADSIPAFIDFQSTGTLTVLGLTDNDGLIENTDGGVSPQPGLSLAALDTSGTFNTTNF